MLYWTWCFPQTFLGFIISLFLKDKNISIYNNKIVIFSDVQWAVSLGKYIIIGSVYKEDENAIKHEYGHCIQSLMLGPLYLLVIGLPSIVMNIISRMSMSFASRYYQRWPESWADKLGKVKRI